MRAGEAGGTRRVRHGKVSLALHVLRESSGPALLLLHGLGERSPVAVPGRAAAWPGAVYALDFTGHGESDVPVGGGYSAEILMADADAALAELGRATLLGRGLGAYVALLLAGARPTAVRGALLTDGPGLAGGGGRPATPMLARVAPAGRGGPDGFALVELARDVRPPDYATDFARQALGRSGLACPIVVSAVGRPEWLLAVSRLPGVACLPLAEGLAALAAATGEASGTGPASSAPDGEVAPTGPGRHRDVR